MSPSFPGAAPPAPGWTTEEMAALGRLHADLEAKRELEPLLDTLVPEPAYEFHPAGLRLAGGENVRRYYTQFFSDFMEKIVGYTLREEWVNATSVAQEYDITVEVEGVPETHRVLGVLFGAQGENGVLLGGERVYGSERIVRLMTGEMFDALEPIGEG